MNTAVDSLLDQAFAWFTGVVEDINDPLEMGRMRVRCIGYHSESKTEIPTDALPWATPVMPINSAGVSGIGVSATGVLQGSWVVGFFRDGRSAQDPIVLGTIPTSTAKSDSSKGFADPAGKYPLEDGEKDIPMEARTNAYWVSESLAKRLGAMGQAVASLPKIASTPDIVDGMFTTKSTDVYMGRIIPKDIETKINPKYPKNQVFRSESGHVREIDDTPGAERTLDQHMSGTHQEIFADGRSNTIIVGDNYQVVLKNNYIYVKGECNLTVDGGLRTFVKGTYLLEVEGDKIEHIRGNRYSRVTGDDVDHVYRSAVCTDTASIIAYKEDFKSAWDTGFSGIQLQHPLVNVQGNFTVSTGANTSFTSIDGKQITVADGIIVKAAVTQ